MNDSSFSCIHFYCIKIYFSMCVFGSCPSTILPVKITRFDLLCIFCGICRTDWHMHSKMHLLKRLTEKKKKTCSDQIIKHRLIVSIIYSVFFFFCICFNIFHLQIKYIFIYENNSVSLFIFLLLKS